jgi:transposase
VTSVIIGMDPHKRSATIEIIDERETVLHTGRFGTDQDGYHRMLATGRRHAQRLWAVEGSPARARVLIGASGSAV